MLVCELKPHNKANPKQANNGQIASVEMRRCLMMAYINKNIGDKLESNVAAATVVDLSAK